jgi:hypothetical protein
MVSLACRDAPVFAGYMCQTGLTAVLDEFGIVTTPGARCERNSQCLSGVCKETSIGAGFQCRAKMGVDESCNIDSECATGYCGPTQADSRRRCKLLPVGRPTCLSDSHCEDPGLTFCDTHAPRYAVCKRYKRPGQFCSRAAECLKRTPGIMPNGNCRLGRCSPWEDGSVCASNSDCYSGNCDQNECKASSTTPPFVTANLEEAPLDASAVGRVVRDKMCIEQVWLNQYPPDELACAKLVRANSMCTSPDAQRWHDALFARCCRTAHHSCMGALPGRPSLLFQLREDRDRARDRTNDRKLCATGSHRRPHLCTMDG